MNDPFEETRKALAEASQLQAQLNRQILQMLAGCNAEEEKAKLRAIRHGFEMLTFGGFQDGGGI